MQFQFRESDKGASSYAPPSPFTPQYLTQSFIGKLWREDMGSESSVREELLVEQAIMRRFIEAELRMELMVERELAIMRSAVEVSLFDRSITTSLRLKEYEMLAFMCGSSSGGGVYGNSTVTKPLSDEDRLPPMAMPLGIKRKAEVAGGNQLHSCSKKMKTENNWTCPLCQVSATCEKGLRDHFQGMMHKAKEASLRKSEKLKEQICSPDPFPNDNEEQSQVNEKEDKNFWCPICEISTNSRALMKMHWSGKKHMARLKRKSGALEAVSSFTDDDGKDTGETTAIDEDASPVNAERTEETGAREDTSKEQDKLLQNKRQTNPTFWCQTCKIGTTSEDSMKEHQKGKKHIAKLRKESGRTIIGVSSLPDEAKDVGETTAMEEETSPSNAGRTEEIERQTNAKFWCQTCEIGTTSEDSMKEHQKGKKHIAKLRKESGRTLIIGIYESENVGETTQPQRKMLHQVMLK